MDRKRPDTYWNYIRVEDLLALQGGIENDAQKLENDEVMFITVHQVFELWFQLMLREMRSTRDLFCASYRLRAGAVGGRAQPEAHQHAP